MTIRNKAAPALSVILVTDHYHTISLVVACFAAQTIHEQVEMVIVLPEGRADEVPVSELSQVLNGVRVVEVASIRPMPASRAAGVRATTAPVVFIGETHSFPHRRFAELIVDAHKGPWDVVVPGLLNANPSTPKSWAAFLLDYGYWHAGLSPSPIGSGPTWNASYKREVLSELGDMLDTALSSGDELPHELRARNRRVYFEPRAHLDHTNVEVSGWADERFLSGLIVGANRRKRWSVPRRAFYFAASPLIPFVLLYRTARPTALLLRDGSMPRGSLAALITGAFVRTAGEAAGYMSGISQEDEQRMEDYELYKLRFASKLRGAVEALA
ncbi:MAG TPA: hypothetical protein VF042_08475 [Gemmatimonadaceae bacterium]